MYKKVLVAVDFSTGSQKIMKRAIELVANDIEKLHLVHIVESVPVVWGMHSYAIDPVDLQNKVLEGSRISMQEFAKGFNIPEDRQQVIIGTPAPTIREYQSDIGADAIVIGSHGHSGWKIMLGSTANSLLHGATVDVLTVHVPDEN
ncbi:MAG: universal stress protein [Pseudomonadales bacterium]|nr:universal stress protein [Pseudomonadales bacterium]